ncbi:MAG: toxic anion resistance protein [Cellulomonas sp.]|uniref:toxic anion resistance protein n=1 Tax=unclassified Cellulomonas TaxID=2620175 RepID=UPI0006527BC2|nr:MULTISPECIES: toxic anion resistance protein [unclassified Cellulomonas]KMM45345.1 toxic anion resistance protein [Cellulomonas sp. A375-1]MCR6647582.1 toxic anion resistance protein [Cellulomonas sp.]MCR6703571.1 toxic anion resistance protein [Cellulomonas sp.]
MTQPAAGAPAPLTPPLELEAPAPLAPVAQTQAPAIAPRVDEAALPGLDAKVDSYLAGLASAQAGSPEFAAKAEDVRTMGDADVRAAAETSNRLLQMPVQELRDGGVSGTSQVSKSLLDLRRTVEELDPSEASLGKKILGFLPFGDSITDYFRRYESAQKQIDAIVQALYNGQDELRKDNAALNLEKQHLWATMARLNQYVYVAEKLDTKLATLVAEAERTDPQRAKSLREDVLFYVRQKHQDLLTQLAVSIQGYLATDIIIKNNGELIKGVDRATTTTVAALRTAVLVAQALNNQKLVLDQISALNSTTTGMIASTSKLLREQSVQIQEQAASSTLGLPQLQQAFNDIYATMDAIDGFKVKALDSMAQTIGVLETETTKARSYLDRVQKSDQTGAAGGSLDLG